MKGKRRQFFEERIGEGTYVSLKDLYEYATWKGIKKKSNNITKKSVFSWNTTPTERLSDLLKLMQSEHQ